jgi:N-methylhydantoinase B
VRLLADRGSFTNRSDAQGSPAPAELGGGAGAPSRHRLEHPDGRTTAFPSKVTSMDISAWEVIGMETAGGGGYGRPTERDLDAVLADVLDGKVSEAEALAVYGVVVRLAEGTIDPAATAELRARFAAGEIDHRPRFRSGRSYVHRQELDFHVDRKGSTPPRHAASRCFR